tara:strand:- start:858 stop:1190 length:333 start_codon:yes stop_codon:yes gene_type:complete
MSYKELGQYLAGLFIGGLGLFNSWKLEARQVIDSNNELLWQNGMIISGTLVLISLSGFIGEWANMWLGPYQLKKVKKHKETFQHRGESDMPSMLYIDQEKRLKKMKEEEE